MEKAKQWHKRCRAQCKGTRALRKRKCGTSGVGHSPLREWHDLQLLLLLLLLQLVLLLLLLLLLLRLLFWQPDDCGEHCGRTACCCLLLLLLLRCDVISLQVQKSCRCFEWNGPIVAQAAAEAECFEAGAAQFWAIDMSPQQHSPDDENFGHQAQRLRRHIGDNDRGSATRRTKCRLVCCTSSA